MPPFSAIARGLSLGLERAHQLQLEAMERRLREQAMQPQLVDVSAYLPPEVRQRAGLPEGPMEMPIYLAPGYLSGLFSTYGRQPEQPAALPAEFLTDWLTA